MKRTVLKATLMAAMVGVSAGEQRSREARGEPVRFVPVVPDTPDQFTDSTPALHREGYEYYRTARAQHPNSPNRYVFSSLPLQMVFFPLSNSTRSLPGRCWSSQGPRPTRSSGARKSTRRPRSRRNCSSFLARRTSTCTTSRNT